MDAGALMRLDRALDGFLCDMARRNYSERSRDDYFRNLCRLFEELPTDPIRLGSDRGSGRRKRRKRCGRLFRE